MSYFFGLGRTARLVTVIGFISVLSTLIAMLTGVLFIAVISLPNSFILILMPVFLIQALGVSLQLAWPVTLALLPAAAFFLGYRTTFAMVALPVIGLVGGAASIWLRVVLTSGHPPSGVGFEVLLAAGMTAGLAAGAFFGRAMYEMNK